MKQTRKTSVLTASSIFPHPLVKDFPELLKIVEGLSNSHKRQLVQKLMDDCFSLNVVLGGVNNCFNLKIDSNAERISKQLENLPPEAVQALVEGIALLISPPRPK